MYVLVNNNDKNTLRICSVKRTKKESTYNNKRKNDVIKYNMGWWSAKNKKEKKRKNPIAHAQAVAKTHAEMNV